MKGSNALSMILVAILWLLVSMACLAEKSNQPDASEKPVLKFKLLIGKQFPLCKDYVDILNKAQYPEIPVCERKIIPEFGKFKAVKWMEITNKEEIKMLMKEEIRLRNKWLINGQIEGESKGKVYGKSGQPDYKKNMEAAFHDIDKRIGSDNSPRAYKASIDMDHDGEKDDVYEFIINIPSLAKNKVCKDINLYMVKYKDPQKTENAYSKLGGATNPGLTSESRLFFYDGKVFQDYWEGLSARYHLKVNEVSGLPNQLCGINVVR